MSNFDNGGLDSLDASQLTACPFLGLQDDPHTHFGWPQANHFCYRADPPHSVIEQYQRSHCLNRGHLSCQIYDKTWSGPLPRELRGQLSKPWRTRSAAISMPFFNRETEGDGAPFEPMAFQDEDANGDFEPWQQMRSAGFVNEEIDEPAGKPAWWIYISVVALVGIIISCIVGYFIFYGPNRDSGNGSEQLASAAEFSPPTPTPTETSIPPPATREPTGTLPPSLTPIPSETPQPTITAFTLQSVYECTDSRAYTFDLLSGPNLVPDPGYTYDGGALPVAPEVTWTIQTTSSCDWFILNIYSMLSGRLLAPIITVDGIVLEQSYPFEDVIVKPGQVVDISLIFSPENARYISNEWIVEANGFRLSDQAHLIIDVSDWVIAVIVTPTPESGGAGGNGGSGGSSNPAPTVPPSRP
jgi:hypothetical protein